MGPKGFVRAARLAGVDVDDIVFTEACRIAYERRVIGCKSNRLVLAAAAYIRRIANRPRELSRLGADRVEYIARALGEEDLFDIVDKVRAAEQAARIAQLEEDRRNGLDDPCPN